MARRFGGNVTQRQRARGAAQRAQRRNLGPSNQRQRNRNTNLNGFNRNSGHNRGGNDNQDNNRRPGLGNPGNRNGNGNDNRNRNGNNNSGRNLNRLALSGGLTDREINRYALDDDLNRRTLNQLADDDVFTRKTYNQLARRNVFNDDVMDNLLDQDLLNARNAERYGDRRRQQEEEDGLLPEGLAGNRSDVYNDLFEQYGISPEEIANFSDATRSDMLLNLYDEERSERDRARSLADFDRTLEALDLSKQKQVEQAADVSYRLTTRQAQENYRQSLNQMYGNSLTGFWN